MDPLKTTRISFIILAALVLASVNPTAGTTDDGIECGAGFITPNDGQLVLNTQLGNVPVDTGASVQGVFVSTTGFIDVEIEHRCLEFLALTVFKIEADGTKTLIHENSGWLECADEGTLEDSVEIGLDAGEYEFNLDWFDCTGREGGDGRRPVGVDPPLPVGPARIL